MHVITIDKTDPDAAAAVAGCEVGVPQTFTITMTPVSDDEVLLVGKFAGTDISYTEGAEEGLVEEVAPVAAEAPYKPKAKAGSATAI